MSEKKEIKDMQSCIFAQKRIQPIISQDMNEEEAFELDQQKPLIQQQSFNLENQLPKEYKPTQAARPPKTQQYHIPFQQLLNLTEKGCNVFLCEQANRPLNTEQDNKVICFTQDRNVMNQKPLILNILGEVQGQNVSQLFEKKHDTRNEVMNNRITLDNIKEIQSEKSFGAIKVDLKDLYFDAIDARNLELFITIIKQFESFVLAFYSPSEVQDKIKQNLKYLEVIVTLTSQSRLKDVDLTFSEKIIMFQTLCLHGLYPSTEQNKFRRIQQKVRSILCLEVMSFLANFSRLYLEPSPGCEKNRKNNIFFQTYQKQFYEIFDSDKTIEEKAIKLCLMYLASHIGPVQ